jgi:hypothetical protein
MFSLSGGKIPVRPNAAASSWVIIEGMPRSILDFRFCLLEVPLLV